MLKLFTMWRRPYIVLILKIFYIFRGDFAWWGMRYLSVLRVLSRFVLRINTFWRTRQYFRNVIGKCFTDTILPPFNWSSSSDVYIPSLRNFTNSYDHVLHWWFSESQHSMAINDKVTCRLGDYCVKRDVRLGHLHHADQHTDVHVRSAQVRHGVCKCCEFYSVALCTVIQFYKNRFGDGLKLLWPP